jgi:hypothetical protein
MVFKPVDLETEMISASPTECDRLDILPGDLEMDV